MRTTVTEDRLLVVSDLHLGNRLHSPRRAFMDFLHFAIDNDYSICINGDGIDISQMSLTRLTGDLSPCLKLFMRVVEHDRRIYYTVGNHDIVLEHFLSDLGRMAVVPFLNLHSGDQRIRIEHGHMYDEMFLRFPRLYWAFTYIGRLAINVSPEFYDRLHDLNQAIIGFGEFVLSLLGDDEEEPEEGIPGERTCFRDGAERVSLRGFDAVVFGHTHIPGARLLSSGVAYYNTGSWFNEPRVLAIHRGRRWFGRVTELVEGGDPFSGAEEVAGERHEARVEDGVQAPTKLSA